MGIEGEVALHDPQRDGLHILRTLSQDDAVGSVACYGWFAEITHGEQSILMKFTLGIYQEDAEGRVNISVLEAIIQQDYLRALMGGKAHQVGHSPTAITIDDEAHLGVLLLDLLGFVPDFAHGRA